MSFDVQLRSATGFDVPLTSAATLTVTPSGIVTAEAFGVANVIGPVLPTGIASGEAHGVATVIADALVSPTGIPTGEAHGTASLTLVLQPAGIPSEETFGVSTLAHILQPTGITSGEAFGLVEVKGSIVPTGIPSAEAFGTPFVGAVIRPTSIASAEAFGTAVIADLVQITGIPTGEAFGTPNVIGPIIPTGIASAAAIGAVTVVAASIQPIGIPSSEAHGVASVNHILSALGIATGEAHGVATLTSFITPFGITSGEAHGVTNVIGPVLPTGIPSGEAHGVHRVGAVITTAFAPNTPTEGATTGGTELTLYGSIFDMGNCQYDFGSGLIYLTFWDFLAVNTGMPYADRAAVALRAITGSSAGSIAGLRTKATEDDVDVAVTITAARLQNTGLGVLEVGSLALRIDANHEVRLSLEATAAATHVRARLTTGGVIVYNHIVATTGPSATLRLLRVGHVVTGYVGGVAVFTAPWVSTPTKIELRTKNDAVYSTSCNTKYTAYTRTPVVVVGDTPATITYASYNRVVAITPPKSTPRPGAVDVRITGCHVSETLTNGFTYTINDRLRLTRALTILNDEALTNGF